MRRGAWIAIASAAAVTIGTAFVSQSAVLPVAAFSALSVLAWFLPRLFAGVGLLLVVLAATLRATFPSLNLGFLDEIVVVVAVVVLTTRRLVCRQLPVIPSWALWFLGFVAAGLLSSLLNVVPNNIVFDGGFLAVKAMLLGVAFAQIDWKPGDLQPFIAGGGILTVIIFVTSMINLIAPDLWTSLVLGRNEQFEGEFGLPALIGPFEYPATLGRFCALLAIAILAYRLTVRATWRSVTLLAMASISALGSFRVKTVVSLIGSAALVAGLSLKRMPPKLLLALIIGGAALAVPIGLFVWADIVKYIVNVSARSLLTFGAVDVAARNFPLGAGFGRYGSYTAAVYYSPEYIRLGFNSVYGMRSTLGGGRFLTDTQWPAILGETGWLGAMLFAGGLVHIAITFLRKSAARTEPLVAWLRITGLGWLLILVIESIAAPVFTSPPAYPLPFVAAGIYFSLLAGHSQSTQEK